MRISHHILQTGSSLCGVSLILVLLLASSHQLSAQRKVSADVEVKQVYDGKVLTTTKSVYCSNDGRMVVVFHKPDNYIVVTNTKGETKVYFPKSNEVIMDNGNLISSKDELISLFMNGRVDDLGLGLFGYRQVSSGREGNYLKKTFKASDNANVPTVEIVYDNYLPIYSAYIGKDGNVLSENRYSHYETFSRFVLPCRIDAVNHNAKNDSTIIRTIYSNVRIDVDGEWFNYEVPSNAKPLPLNDVKNQLKQMTK